MTVTLPARHIYTFNSKNQNIFPEDVFCFQQKAWSVSSKTKWQFVFSLRDKDQSLGKLWHWTLKISLEYTLACLMYSTTFCRNIHRYLGCTPNWSEPELTLDLRSNFRYFRFRAVNWQNLKEEKKGHIASQGLLLGNIMNFNQVAETAFPRYSQNDGTPPSLKQH